MKDRYVKTTGLDLRKRERIKDVNIIIPRIRSEFYVRLLSALDTAPEIIEGGYEFFIKDMRTGFEFSAGLTAFGPGYFAEEDTIEAKKIIDLFHEQLFNEFNDLKECKIEIEDDHGKSIFGYENGNFIELDIENE